MELYRLEGHTLSLLPRKQAALERQVQRIFESNLEAVFGIRFLASEHSTGEKHGGRIDSLGIDENGTPVIVEYKLTSSENVINQALYYLDWLVDHQGDFTLLVHKKLGTNVAIDWTAPRVLCIADSFSKYDTYAVQQMGRNIQLAQYKLFQGDYLLVDVVGGSVSSTSYAKSKSATSSIDQIEYSVEEQFKHGNKEMQEIAEELRQFFLQLGEDVTESPVKNYVAYRTIRNFCCVEVHQKHVFLYLTLDPAISSDYKFCRDVSKIGHYGTGNLEVRVEAPEQVPDAKHLIELAYRNSVGIG